LTQTWGGLVDLPNEFGVGLGAELVEIDDAVEVTFHLRSLALLFVTLALVRPHSADKPALARLFVRHTGKHVVAQSSELLDDRVSEVLVGIEGRHGSGDLVLIDLRGDLERMLLGKRPSVDQVYSFQARVVVAILRCDTQLHGRYAPRSVVDSLAAIPVEVILARGTISFNRAVPRLSCS
jgi:hypothetical protein